MGLPDTTSTITTMAMNTQMTTTITSTVMTTTITDSDLNAQDSFEARLQVDGNNIRSGLKENLLPHSGPPNIPSFSIHTPGNKKLPTFLLSNIQSFGNSPDTDKTTELEAVITQNNIDIACLTQTLSCI